MTINRENPQCGDTVRLDVITDLVEVAEKTEKQNKRKEKRHRRIAQTVMTLLLSAVCLFSLSGSANAQQMEETGMTGSYRDLRTDAEKAADYLTAMNMGIAARELEEWNPSLTYLRHRAGGREVSEINVDVKASLAELTQAEGLLETLHTLLAEEYHSVCEQTGTDLGMQTVLTTSDDMQVEITPFKTVWVSKTGRPDEKITLSQYLASV